MDSKFSLLSMNVSILNIINTFAFFTSLAFISNVLGFLTGSLSLFFLVVLNARKAYLEIKALYQLFKARNKPLK
jgi:uncharacterized membrane protein YdjX (TVP38/TMEM64 family)